MSLETAGLISRVLMDWEAVYFAGKYILTNELDPTVQFAIPAGVIDAAPNPVMGCVQELQRLRGSPG